MGIKSVSSGFVWAGMIVIATWPVYTAIRRRVRNSRWIAASVMVMLIILLFVFPLALLINSIVENSEPLMRWVKSLAADTAGALLA